MLLKAGRKHCSMEAETALVRSSTHLLTSLGHYESGCDQSACDFLSNAQEEWPIHVEGFIGSRTGTNITLKLP